MIEELLSADYADFADTHSRWLSRRAELAEAAVLSRYVELAETLSKPTDLPMVRLVSTGISASSIQVNQRQITLVEPVETSVYPTCSQREYFQRCTRLTLSR